MRGIGETARPVLGALEAGELGQADMGAKDLEMLVTLRKAVARVKGDEAEALGKVLSAIEVRVRALSAKRP